MKNRYSKNIIADLVNGKLDSEGIQLLQKEKKDEDRLKTVIQIKQEQLGWKEPIVALLQEHLLVVEKGDRFIVRCDCGQEFCEYTENWKEYALVYIRHPRDGVIFNGPRGADPDWMELREFYCPACAAQLDVEMVPPGYPFLFHFVPDLAR